MTAVVVALNQMTVFSQGSIHNRNDSLNISNLACVEKEQRITYCWAFAG